MPDTHFNPPTTPSDLPGRRLSLGSIGRRPGAPVRLAPIPKGKPSLLEQLRQQPLFSLLPDGLLAMLASSAQIRRYDREACVVHQDQLDSNLYLLVRGRAHAERLGANDRQVLLAVLEPGARIGEMGLIDGQPHNATVRCVLPSEVLVLRGVDVLNCQAECLPFSQAWMVDLVTRLRDINRRITTMSLLGVRERVLWQLNEWSSPDETGVPVVSSRVGRNELARIVGASREMVCRVLRALQDSGELELRSDRSIALRSPALATAIPCR